MICFHAMNTEVLVSDAAADEQAAGVRVAATFAAAERRFSRFWHDSELSRLNRTHGPMVVSAQMFDALVQARTYVDMTGGLFDPGIAATLIALGYDRTFSPGRLDRHEVMPTGSPGRFAELILDPATRTVTRPPHLLIDLGGMVKGRTVDEAAHVLSQTSAIDAGGDAVLRGNPAGADAWLVDVEDPRDHRRVVATLGLANRAVATSTPNRRRWRTGTSMAHHLIDPRSQRPGNTDLLQVTVVAQHAELAEVLAKTVFLLGSRSGRAFLEAQSNVGGVLIRRDGAVLLVGDIDVREVHRN